MRGLDSDTSDKKRLRVERDILVALAGMEAQRRFRSRSVRRYHAQQDYQNAVDRASYFFPDPEVLSQFNNVRALSANH
jgi:hypothetical protein